MTSRFHRLTLSGVLWLITLMAAEPGLAFQGMQFEAPPPIPGKPNQFSKATGVRVEVDTRWFGMGGGYLPARVEVEARAAQIVARRIEVTLVLSTSQGRWSQDMDESANSVRFGLTLPANETSVEGTVLCLVPTGWDSVGQLVEVDGQPDAELSFMMPVRVNQKNTGRFDFEALRVLRPVLKPGQLDRVQRDASFGSSARSWLILGDVKSEPFDDWLAYSAVDVIRLSLTELEAIAKDQPERLAAIRRWLIAGGTLWVERVESDGSAPMEKLALGEIDELLSLQRWQFVASEAEKNPSLGPPAAASEGDTLIDRADQNDPDGLPDPDAVRERVFPSVEAPPWGYLQSETLPPSLLRQGSDVLAERKTLFRQTGRLDSRSWYAVRNVGFGKVYAFRQSATIAPRSLPPGIDEVTKKAFREGDWPRRHGLHVGGKSLAFGNLLIPGVGVAPIVEFQVLITLFVLAIGPLNYWLLWRRQQLQLLVITAPLGALAVTLGLFAYAAVADGFGVKARARSLTLLDQTTGEAASWSRVTHYAATPPAEPATFDGETAIYPITPALDSAMGRMKRSRVIEWEDKTKAGDGSSLQQRLVSGWMPTRTAVQHLLIRSRATPAKLVFTGDDGDGGATEVENQLGASIEWLLIRDSSGDWRQAYDLGAGDKAATIAADFSDLAREYRLLNVENEPQFPIGAGKAIEQTLDRLGATSRRRKSGLSDVEINANLANDRLRDLSGLAGGDTLNLPPRSYLAVTRSAVETPLGWENVRESGSFHITVGRW